MDGERSLAEILLSGGIILVVQLWVWFYGAVSSSEGRCRKAKTSHDPSRLYVVA